MALTSWDQASGTSILSVMPFPSGPRRELFKAQDPESFQNVIWTPDGRDIVVRKNRVEATGAQSTEFWRIGVAAGAALKLELNATGVLPVSFHPDGRTIAFESGERKFEVWVMENLIHELRALR
jgi:hypothetical protein